MEIQSYLNQKYQGHESFVENIIYPIFGEDNYDTAYDVELLDNDELLNQAENTGIRSVLRCGTINLDPTPIEVYDITVSDRVMMEKNRVSVQALIRRIMDTYSGAFMIFHYDNDVKWDWRFTFCLMKDKNEFTDSKRYTFLLGPNQSCRTAAQNFQKLADLNQVISIDDIRSAFDVEALSKEFFRKYKSHYERFVEYITGKKYVKDGNHYIEITTHTPHPKYYAAFGNNDKAVRDYVKITLGRIILCHFIQKKGWLGVPEHDKWGKGDEQFMKYLYLKATDKQQDDFLESVLEPLFFDGLDTDRRKDGDVFNSCVFGKIRVPYLNGGLFGRSHSDDVEVKFPKEYFAELLEFFSEYNFTIDENDPNEAQVGIDPEMLSQIFENLLEDNKDKGAFYTPKEIVKYMCQESLIAYLKTKTGYDEDRLRRFVQNPDIVVIEFNEDEKASVLDAIMKVKICDPAIGSGAFPIGMLNELVRCKEVLCGDKKARADIKREIIRDNIYGVDIEKGAVDIARLRFWLSLVVDEEEPTPLPNLDFKIMQGNSLLEQYNGVDLSSLLDVQDGTISWGNEVNFRERLAALMKSYFDCEEHFYKEAIKLSISELIKERLAEFSLRGPYGDKIINMTSIDIAANTQFFLWHTWFADVFNSGGFDIIIGNPPYIKEYTNKSAFNGFRETSSYYMGKMDLWYGFSCICIDYLKNNGVLCFIAQNNWTTSAGAKIMRNKVIEETVILQLVDFNEYMVFEESANIQTMIMLFKKNSVDNNYVTDLRRLLPGAKIDDMLFLLAHVKNEKLSFFTYTVNRANFKNRLITFSVQDELLNKIANGKSHLTNKELAQGIVFPQDYLNRKSADFLCHHKVGDGVFGLSSAELESLNIPKNEQILIKPYFTTEQIHRYYTNPKNTQWMIYTDSSFKNKKKMDDFPVIKKHLDQFLPIFTSDNKPYGLHRARKEKFFKGEKIISLRKCVDHPCFSYSTCDCYVSQTFFVIKTERWNMLYLTGLLNSKLIEFWLRNRGKMQGENFQVDKEPLIAIPIASSKDIEKNIAIVVTQILKAKSDNPSCDISMFEKTINELIYELYELSDDDVKIIEAK